MFMSSSVLLSAIFAALYGSQASIRFTVMPRYTEVVWKINIYFLKTYYLHPAKSGNQQSTKLLLILLIIENFYSYFTHHRQYAKETSIIKSRKMPKIVVQIVLKIIKSTQESGQNLSTISRIVAVCECSTWGQKYRQM